MTENNNTKKIAQKVRNWPKVVALGACGVLVVVGALAASNETSARAIKKIFDASLSMLSDPVDDALGITYWDKYQGRETDGWTRDDYKNAILTSPAVENCNEEAIARMQEKINFYLKRKGQSPIAEDGIVGKETTTEGLYKLSSNELEDILNNKTIGLGKARPEENSADKTNAIEKVSESKITVGESSEPERDEISNFKTLQLRNAFWHRWLKDQKNDNPEVRVFQEAVNKVLGRKALVVDGIKGWRTDEMLFEMSTEKFNELLKDPEMEKVFQKMLFDMENKQLKQLLQDPEMKIFRSIDDLDMSLLNSPVKTPNQNGKIPNQDVKTPIKMVDGKTY